MSNRGRPTVALAVVIGSSFPGTGGAQDLYEPAAMTLEGTVERLLSALSVRTSQEAHGRNVTSTAGARAAEGYAASITAHQMRLSAVDQQNRYRLGREQAPVACAVVDHRGLARAAGEAGRTVAEAIAKADREYVASLGSADDRIRELRSRREELYCSADEFAAGLCAQFAGTSYNTGFPAGDTNAAIVMGGSGGSEELAVALDYVDRIAPLPTIEDIPDLESGVRRIAAERQAARMSMARTLLSGSAVEGLQ